MSVSQLAEPARKPQGSAACLREGKDFSCSSSFGSQGAFKNNACGISYICTAGLKLLKVFDCNFRKTQRRSQEKDMMKV